MIGNSNGPTVEESLFFKIQDIIIKEITKVLKQI